MLVSQIRAKARKKLTGKWGKCALTTLLYSLIIFMINFITSFFDKTGLSFLSFVLNIGWLIISIPIIFGLIGYFIKIYQGQDPDITDFILSGFAQFKRSWCVFGNIIRKMVLPIVLFVVFYFVFLFSYVMYLMSLGSSSPAILLIASIALILSAVYLIPKSLLYVLSYYVAIDNPEKTPRECVQRSEDMMLGDRGHFFLLMLSFIGWIILSAFTFGIGFLWLAPYIYVSIVAFYYVLKEAKPENIVPNEVVTEDSKTEE